MALRTFECWEAYQVYPSQVAHLAESTFHIPASYQHCFSRYQLLFWDREYFFSQLEEGCLYRDGYKFIVIFLTSREYIRNGWSSQVKLSFRKPKPEFDLPGYVLVKSGDM